MADEWLLQPSINYDIYSNERGRIELPANLITTPALEFLYCMVNELQDTQNLFQEH